MTNRVFSKTLPIPPRTTAVAGAEVATVVCPETAAYDAQHNAVGGRTMMLPQDQFAPAVTSANSALNRAAAPWCATQLMQTDDWEDLRREYQEAQRRRQNLGAAIPATSDAVGGGASSGGGAHNGVTNGSTLTSPVAGNTLVPGAINASRAASPPVVAGSNAVGGRVVGSSSAPGSSAGHAAAESELLDSDLLDSDSHLLDSGSLDVTLAREVLPGDIPGYSTTDSAHSARASGSAITGSTARQSTLPPVPVAGRMFPGTTIPRNIVAGASAAGSSVPGNMFARGMLSGPPAAGGVTQGNTMARSIAPGTPVPGGVTQGNTMARSISPPTPVPSGVVAGNTMARSFAPPTPVPNGMITGSSIARPGTPSTASMVAGSTVIRGMIPGSTVIKNMVPGALPSEPQETWTARLRAMADAMGLRPPATVPAKQQRPRWFYIAASALLLMTVALGLFAVLKRPAAKVSSLRPNTVRAVPSSSAAQPSSLVHAAEPWRALDETVPIRVHRPQNEALTIEAARALALGENKRALQSYKQLLATQPNDVTLRTIVKVLERRRERESDGIGR